MKAKRELLERLEGAAQACHAAMILSCEATCREAAVEIARLRKLTITRPEAAVRTITTQEQRDEWRKKRGLGMTSAIGEYTPSEFWKLLDDVDRLTRSPQLSGEPK